MFMQDIARLARAAAPVGRPEPTPLCGPLTGLLTGTLVETATGWQPVERLAVGDRLQTLDGGLRPILGLDRREVAAEAMALHLPGGAFGNCADLLVLPGQELLVDTLGALEDAAFARFPAAALEGIAGIHRVPLAQASAIVILRFAEEEAIWANSGLLLHCPALPGESGETDCFYPQVGAAEARALIAPFAKAA